MAIMAGQLTDALQALIDARLDTVDRMLVGRVPRQDRLAIVREVESQIFELLPQREGSEVTRDDVLAVLNRLDPPEAYLPDDEGATSLPSTPRRPGAPAPERPETAGGRATGVERACGIVGVGAVSLVVLTVLIYALAAVFEAEALAYLAGFTYLLAVKMSVAGLILLLCCRRRNLWTVLGGVGSLLTLTTPVLLTAAYIMLAN